MTKHENKSKKMFESNWTEAQNKKIEEFINKASTIRDFKEFIENDENFGKVNYQQVRYHAENHMNMDADLDRGKYPEKIKNLCLELMDKKYDYDYIVNEVWLKHQVDVDKQYLYQLRSDFIRGSVGVVFGPDGKVYKSFRKAWEGEFRTPSGKVFCIYTKNRAKAKLKHLADLTPGQGWKTTMLNKIADSFGQPYGTFIKLADGIQDKDLWEILRNIGKKLNLKFHFSRGRKEQDPDRKYEA
ncbi:MAG: hypothetical protein K9L56_14440 [Clostridiales bacterium]|nr:hypothetical protein [Clostridiales bacterium]